MARQGPYRYDAFISYRHAEADRAWAKRLHGALERFRTPRALVRQGLPRRLERVFRDEEELPASSDLSAQIEAALEASRFLIVVCSPRTPASRWVEAEIERFRALGRGEHILALLIEGEPAESFPRALREIRRRVVDAAGAGHETIEEVEPLAADVRPSRTERPRYLARMARLRVLACLLGCRFDDLRRREQERRTRLALGAAGALALLVALLAGLSAYALRQRARAEATLTAQQRDWGREAWLRQDVERAYDQLTLAYAADQSSPALRFLVARARERAESLALEVQSAASVFAGLNLALDPSGRWAALELARTDDGGVRVQVRELPGERVHATLDVGRGPDAEPDPQLEIWALAIDPQARHLLLATARFATGAVIELWDVASRRYLGPLVELDGPETPALAVSPAGTHVAVGLASGVRVHDLATRALAARAEIDSARALVWLDDGTRVAALSGEGELVLLSLGGGDPSVVQTGVVGLAPAPESGAFAWTDAGELLRLADDGSELERWSVGAQPRAAAFVGGARMLVVTLDGDACLAELGDPPVTLSIVSGEPCADETRRALALAPDGRRALVAEADGSVLVLDALAGTPLARLTHAAPQTIESVGFTPDGEHALVVAWPPGYRGRRTDGCLLRVHRLPPRGAFAALDELPAELAAALELELARTDDAATRADHAPPLSVRAELELVDDGTRVTTLDARDARTLASWVVPGSIEWIDVSPDGALVAALELDERARIALRSARDGALQAERTDFVRECEPYGFDASGSVLLVREYPAQGARSELVARDARTLAQRYTLDLGVGEGPIALARDPGRTRVALALAPREDAEPRPAIVALRDGAPVELERASAVVDFAWSPDGALLAGLSRAGVSSVVRVWDAQSGELLATDPPLSVRTAHDAWWLDPKDRGWIRFDPSGAWLVWKRADGSLASLRTSLEDEDARTLRASTPEPSRSAR